MRREMVFLLLGALLVAGILSLVAGTPSDPNFATDLDKVKSQRNTVYASIKQTAEAGNITWMNITGRTQTMTWAGFVGNVTGMIALDDLLNNTLYDWRATEPQGEVYASRGIVNWDNIKCFSHNAASPEINLSSYEAYLGLNANDYDGVDETFNRTDHPTFWVGTHTIQNCWATTLYTNSAKPANDWWNILLTDKTNMVYTAIIEDKTPNVRQGKTGFDGGNYDYQLIVGVNGHNGEDTLWDYYFYVELE